MKVSVIIPVYNNERYLDQCLSSLLSQSFNGFEALVIDDGSTDSSRQIIEKFAKDDNRIRIFKKENGGVSSARNVGIEQAKGEWITFIDSDDYIGENYFSEFMECKNNDSDWIFLDIIRDTIKGLHSQLHFDKFELGRDEFTKSYLLYPHFPGPCGKFYKSEIIKKYHIRFDNRLKFGEDALFNLQYLFKCNKIASVNEGKYYYRYVEGSLSRKEPAIEEANYFYEEVLKVLRCEKADKNLIASYIKFPLERLFYRALESKEDFSTKKRFSRPLIKNFKKELTGFTQNKTVFLSLISFLISTRQLNLIILCYNTRNLFRA